MFQKIVSCIALLFGSISLGAKETNALIVTENGLETYEFALEFIKHATRSIEISGSYMSGWILDEILNVVETRIELYPKLKCHIMTAGLICDDGDKRRIDELRTKYPKNFYVCLTGFELRIEPWMTHSIENHVKMVVVDSKYFSCGGTNLHPAMVSDGMYTLERDRVDVLKMGRFFPAGQRDMDVVGRGPTAKLLREHFFRLYALWRVNQKYQKLACLDPEAYEHKSRYFDVLDIDKPTVSMFEESPRKISDIPIEVILSGPHQQKEGAISSKYKQLIQEAQESIDIGSMLFFPKDHIYRLLVDAADRGIYFSLITNGTYANSPGFNSKFAWATRVHFAPLFYGDTFSWFQQSKASRTPINNVSIYEYHVDDILYHKKVMVVDQKTTAIGSYNFGNKSDNCHYEIALVIDSPAVAQDVLQVLEVDKSLSESILPDQAHKWYFDPLIDFKAKTSMKLAPLFY